MENYCADALFYVDSCKMDPQQKEPNSGNKADIEFEPTEECKWDLNMSAFEELG